MCEFHHRVAMAIAENPETGRVDLTRYSLASVALAGFWMARLMPDMSHLSGSSNLDMATPEAQAALKASGLDTNLDRIKRDRVELVPFVRSAIDEIIAQRSLDLKSLNLPKNPLGFRRPLNLMLEDLYEGPTDRIRTLVKTPPRAGQEPMRAAMEILLAKPGIVPALERLINDSIIELMVKAPGENNPRLQQVFNCIPQPVRSTIANCAMHGGGGALATHALCLGGMAVSGGAGAALMGPAMYVGAPALAMGIETYVNWRNGAKASATRLAAAAAVSFGIAAGINQILPHDHDHMHNEKAEWFENLPGSVRTSYIESQRVLIAALPASLQEEVEEAAKNEGLPPEVFLLTCDGTNPVVAKVNVYRRESGAEAPSIALR